MRPPKGASSVVRRMFDRMDRRDPEGFLAAFDPEARIVHDDGDCQPPRLLAASWPDDGAPPLRRRLLNFHGGSGGGLAWLAYENVASFREGGGIRTLRFAETAVLVRKNDGWRLVRVHYSGKR